MINNSAGVVHTQAGTDAAGGSGFWTMVESIKVDRDNLEDRNKAMQKEPVSGSRAVMNQT